MNRLFSHSQIRYLVAGGTSFVLEYVIFTGLFQYTDHLLLSNSISFIAGLITSFLLHRQWSFRGEHQLSHKYQLAGYVTLALINLVLINTVVSILVTYMHFTPFVAKLVSMLLVVVWNYLILSRLLFKKL